MKKISALIFVLIISLISVFAVNAQSAETIWIQPVTTTYKTMETVTVTLNGNATTPIQGFTAQIRYDPACLTPINGTSPIPGMNGLAVPQTSGLADVSFASTTPQMANGVLAEVRFTALKGCQTNLAIETAALVVRNESGFAVPIPGVTIDQNAVVLNIDNAVGNAQPEATGESVLPLRPAGIPERKPFDWIVYVSLALAGVLIVSIVGLFKFMSPSS